MHGARPASGATVPTRSRRPPSALSHSPSSSRASCPRRGKVAQEALDRPDSTERPHGLAYALSTLALLELERERPHAAEAYARRALDVTAAAGLSGSWTAGLAHTALGAALVSLKRFTEAERHAARGEALRRAPEPTVEEAHALVVLADARLARRRLSAAAADLERAREALEGFADSGSLPALVARVERDLDAARDSAPRLVEEPSRSELAVLRLLTTDLTQRQIGEQLYLSVNTVKTHTRGIYRKLGASSRQEAVAAAETLGLLDDGDDWSSGPAGQRPPSLVTLTSVRLSAATRSRIPWSCA